MISSPVLAVDKVVVIPLFSGMAIGRSITSATAGSILFTGTSGVLAQDNNNLFWNDTNNRLGIGTATPTNPLTVDKYSPPDGLLDAPIKGYYEIDPGDSDIATGILAYIKNIGSTSGSSGHIVGSFGLAEDTESGKHDMYGAEGRVNGLGSAGNIYGVLGLATWQGSSFVDSRQAYGVVGRVEITTDGETPLEEGIVSAFYAPEIIGGKSDVKYSFLGKDPMRVDSAISSYDSATNSKNISLSNDGTTSYLTANETPLAITTFSDNSISLSPNNTPAMTIVIGDTEDMVNIAKVGIGTDSPAYQLQLSTNSAAKPGDGNWTVASDRRLKTDINSFTDGLDVIMDIKPITFKYNGKAGFTDTKTTNIGIIAQDIISIAPYTVGTFKAKLNANDTTETELYNFNSGALTFVTINAIKEQQTEISKLSQKTDSNITKYQQLQTAINAQQEGVQTSLTELTTRDMEQEEKIANLVALTTTLQQQIQVLQDILIKNSILPKEIKKP
ncbi:MAG: tail fiber domain-containing protein [Proteobacteria bacterium]|nr:tail fiber domain-containing protein [Pseudomonadota bacterium]